LPYAGGINKIERKIWLYTQTVKVKEELDLNGERVEKDSYGIIIITNVPK
tara:strand:+ start:126 stop:275 length:150 start_codon:yes stop_codon:yes gene_type:complete